MLESDAKLHDSVPFSDTELCSLLSNALEMRYRPQNITRR